MSIAREVKKGMLFLASEKKKQHPYVLSLSSCISQIKKSSMFEFSGWTIRCFTEFQTLNGVNIKEYHDCMEWPPAIQTVGFAALFIVWLCGVAYFLYQRFALHRRFLRQKEGWIQSGWVTREGLTFTDLETYPGIFHIQSQSDLDHVCKVVALYRRIPREKHGFQLSWDGAELLVNRLKKPAVDALVTTADTKYALDQLYKSIDEKMDRQYRRNSFRQR